MPLSEYEQRVLAQMEQQLRDADPKLAQSLNTRGRVDVARLSVGLIIGFVGLGMLVAGVATTYVWLGILGFVAMLGGALYASSGTKAARNSAAKGKGRTGSASSFMKWQQERWDKREGE